MIFVLMRGYEESVAALGDSDEVHAARRALLAWVAEHADRGQTVPGTSARVVRTRSQHGCSALRLIYRHEADTVYLYRLLPWDELGTEPLRSS